MKKNVHFEFYQVPIYFSMQNIKLSIHVFTTNTQIHYLAKYFFVKQWFCLSVYALWMNSQNMNLSEFQSCEG